MAEESERIDQFWRLKETAVLDLPTAASMPSALERLGASPFPKSRFPFLGFLATAYEHVSAHVAAGRRDGGENPQ